MRTKSLFLILCVISTLFITETFSQVGINDDGTKPDSSAMLDVKSTTKGMLIPRMTSSGRDAITNPARGLLVFCTDDNFFYVNRGSPSLPVWTLVNTQWVNNATDIYFDGGNVGIGTLNPSCRLHIVGGDVKIGDFAGDARKLYFGDGGHVYIGEETTDNRLGLFGSTLTINIGGSTGSNGQVLTSDGTTCTWLAPTVGSPGIGGSGSLNYLTRWLSSDSLGIGITRDDSSTVGINTAPDASYRLKVDGAGINTAVYGHYDDYHFGSLGTPDYGVEGYNQGTTAGNSGVYGYSNAWSAGTPGVYGYNNTTFGGGFYEIDNTVNGVVGFVVGGQYHFGVFGSRSDNAFGPSAGVIGSVDYDNQNKPWGALGFQDASQVEYAGYFDGNIKLYDGINDGTGYGVAGSVLLSNGANDVYWSATPGISGSGTGSYIPKWSNSNTLTNSQINDNGTSICIGTTSSSGKLTVNSSGSSTSVYGQFSANVLGYLGSANYGAYGQSSSGVYGYLGGLSYGAYGQYNSTRFGVLGSSNYGAYGQYSADIYGYLGTTNYGVQGQHTTTGGAAGYFKHDGYPSSFNQQWAVDSYMNNSLANDGTSYVYGANNSGGIRNYNYNGANYTFAVAGWNYNDETRCAGVFGAENFAGYWGALGYKDSGSNTYGGYFTSSTTGTGKSSGSGSAEGIGIGAWGNLIGADIHGGVYGIYVEGNNFGIYSKGTVFSDKPAVQLQDVGKAVRAVTYSNSSTDVTIMTTGQGKLVNGQCSIIFDENFRNVISDQIPAIITVTPLGPSHGVYISSINPDGFSIIENEDGISNADFLYIAVGRRAGYEDPKLPAEVVASDFESNMTEGLHNDADITTNGKGLFYQSGSLRLGQSASMMQNSKKD